MIDGDLSGMRRARGARSYHAGRMAEENVARHYGVRGHTLLAQRWRGRCGEIDLILEGPAGVVFVEVKSSSSLEAAAGMLTERQLGRVHGAAEEFLGQRAAGRDVPARIDVALHAGGGRIEVIENVLAA